MHAQLDSGLASRVPVGGGMPKGKGSVRLVHGPVMLQVRPNHENIFDKNTRDPAA